MDGKVTYLPIYMWYLVKEQSIAQLIVDMDMEGCEEPRVHQKNRSFVIKLWKYDKSTDKKMKI